MLRQRINGRQKIRYPARVTLRSSLPEPPAPATPNEVRPAADDVDRRILTELLRDGRIANNALAERVGIAPSTCLARVRALRDRGAIRGFFADVDPGALGRPLQAMIAVTLSSDSRARISSFAASLSARPQVLNIFFLAGAHDFLLHVAARDTAELREFVVEELSSRAEVAATETNLIFEHVRSTAR